MGLLYLIAGRENLLIGRNARNDIIINDPFISPIHVRITATADGSLAWVCVEGRGEVRINRTIYKSGSRTMICKSDYIYIADVLIMWLKNYLYVTVVGASGEPVLSGGKLRLVNTTMELPVIRPELIKVYVPSVRKRSYYDNSEIEIEPPPSRRAPEKNSLSLAIGPALTMAIPILLGAGRAISVISSVLAAFWAAGNVFNQQKKLKKEEKRRRNSYYAYIVQCEEKLRKLSREYKAVLEENYPVVGAYLRCGPNPFLLWNQEGDMDGAMNVRIGMGECDFPNAIRIPRERFEQLDDSLKELPNNLHRRYCKISACPITVDLNEERVVGLIYDDCDFAYSVLGAIILQIAVSVLPDAVAICFCSDNSEFVSNMGWIRYLPHSGEYAAYEGESNDSDKLIILITDNMMLATRAVCNEWVRLILICPTLSRLPSFARKVISCRGDCYGLLNVGNMKDKINRVKLDRLSPLMCSEYARTLGRIWGIRDSKDSVIPSMVPFHRLYAKDFASIEIENRWRNADTSQSLGFPIGMGIDDKVIELDLHESYAGPHGIIAGTTGSGKSELLTTIILSAAINYPPDKLGFFLIDYKGGGMSNLFKSLPHIMGSISNLSDAEIQRAMLSIKSENVRRQRIFGEAGINNIRDYARAYDAGRVKTALPHILIIIDEFAELKKENPDFMQELISVATVGRSLGVHLILATQKPSGVVDDKIRSNSRFRICLRVEDKMDSNDMLHNTDAASIRECGRGYLQVGNNEVYECFQSAYAMGKRYGNTYNNDIRVSDEAGEELAARAEAAAKITTGADESLKDVTWLEYLIKEIIATDERMTISRPDRLWQPPLPASVKPALVVAGEYGDGDDAYWPESECVTGTGCIIGIADNPSGQSYLPVVYDYKKSGNTVIIGPPGCGKSGLIRSIISGIVTGSDSSRINVFIVDNGGNRLKIYKDSNICGGYINADNISHIPMLLYFIRDMLEVRRRSREGSNAEWPHQLLIVDNYSESVRGNTELAEEIFYDIIKYGPSVGISVICSTSTVGVGELPGRLLDGMDSVYCLGRMESYQVAGYLKQTVGAIPRIAEIVGRGIVVTKEGVLEFQGLDYSDDASITSGIYKQNDLYPGVSSSYPYIPEVPYLEAFLKRAVKEYGQEEIASYGLPVGYDERTGKIYCMPINKVKITLVTGKEGTGKHSFLEMLSVVAARYNIRSYSADNMGSLVGLMNMLSSDKSTCLITISDINSILKETIYEISNEASNGTSAGTTGELEVLCRAFDNTKPNRSNVHIVAIINGRDREYGISEELWNSLMKKPYVLSFGGNLDELRLFDYSYLSYMAQSQEKEPGRCHVRKYKGGMFYGDILIPLNEYADAEQPEIYGGLI